MARAAANLIDVGRLHAAATAAIAARRLIDGATGVDRRMAERPTVARARLRAEARGRVLLPLNSGK